MGGLSMPLLVYYRLFLPVDDYLGLLWFVFLSFLGDCIFMVGGLPVGTGVDTAYSSSSRMLLIFFSMSIFLVWEAEDGEPS